MAKSLPKKDLVSFKELLLANSIQVDALAQLLIEEGLISEQKAQSANRPQPTDRRRNPNQRLQRPQVCAGQSSQGCRELVWVDPCL